MWQKPDRQGGRINQKPDRQGCINQKPDRQGGVQQSETRPSGRVRPESETRPSGRVQAEGYKQMYDSHLHDEFPLAYLITIRCFGTWLHGDERLTVDRHGLNIYGTRRRPANANLERVMKRNMRIEPITFNQRQREIVKKAIKEVCSCRRYYLWAVNVRTNHAHAVVSAQSRPEPIADAFKSYSTRKLREAGLIGYDVRPWARGRSRRYLWKEHHVARAIDYVLFGQGDIPDFND